MRDAGYTTTDRDAAECRRLRTTHGKTLAAMAEIARLSDRQVWAKYENGSREIDLVRWEWCLLMLAEHPALRLAAGAAATLAAAES